MRLFHPVFPSAISGKKSLDSNGRMSSASNPTTRTPRGAPSMTCMNSSSVTRSEYIADMVTRRPPRFSPIASSATFIASPTVAVFIVDRSGRRKSLLGSSSKMATGWSSGSAARRDRTEKTYTIWCASASVSSFSGKWSNFLRSSSSCDFNMSSCTANPKRVSDSAVSSWLRRRNMKCTKDSSSTLTAWVFKILLRVVSPSFERSRSDFFSPRMRFPPTGSRSTCSALSTSEPHAVTPALRYSFKSAT
mmetsp:Transcript_14243/g.59995  ORF Transcript_14243/g.59995 Transcript_14243/m.59995 type:complete len:248 (-) Transcript_14243:1834-2577(-)